MDPRHEQLVRDSWQRLVSDPDPLVAGFYGRLFEIDPEAARLFSGTSMTEQRQKFAAMLEEIVRALDDPHRLIGETAASGRRHQTYGVQAPHYRTVGAALLWAIERELKPEFTPELRDAWSELYELVAAVMQRAGAQR